MSVDTEEEAKDLLAFTCVRNQNGEFVARELAQKQSIDRLFAFGDRLEKCYGDMKKRKKALK